MVTGSKMILQTQDGAYDVSDLISSAVSFEDNINKSGVLSFNILKSDILPDEGNKIKYSYDGEDYFSGYVFRDSSSQSEEVAITAYDQLRYLKANETYIFKGTATKVVARICNDFKLITGELQDTVYNLPSCVFDNKCILDIISDCLSATLTKTNRLFFIKDNCGRIELKNVTTTVSDIVIDPSWLLFAYTFEKSIDDNTYNQIKLSRDNKSTGERELYIAKDSSTIQKWGLLQYTEKVDDNLNPQQIKAMADAYLKLKNKVQKKLSCEVIGDKRIRAGNVICVDIPEHNIRDFLLCTYANHTFDSTGHTVKADFRIV